MGFLIKRVFYRIQILGQVDHGKRKDTGTLYYSSLVDMESKKLDPPSSSMLPYKDNLHQVAKERWEKIKAANPTPSPRQPQPKPLWAAPPMNVYKINYDGQVFAGANKLGIGVVICDCHGQIIAALVQQLGQAYQLLNVEALHLEESGKGTHHLLISLFFAWKFWAI